MKYHRLVLLSIVTIATCLLAGCKKPSSSSHSSGSGKLFGVSFQTMNNPFFVELNNGLKAEVEAQGGRLVTPTPISLPSGPSHWLFQRPPAESKLLAAELNGRALTVAARGWQQHWNK